MEHIIRCDWPKDNQLMIEYHDEQWGVPLHDDDKLFEFMVLDTFQAGLSWAIILKKRKEMHIAFDHFNPEKIAYYNDNHIQKLLANPLIIRNKIKINATIQNAKVFLKIKEKFGSFDNYIWQFTEYKSINNRWLSISDIPVKSVQSDSMSIELKKNGFTFVGSTICYAFMQATGMVNDHIINCFRYNQILKLQNNII
jgi:DNA-3-methyladenine glycosylase I